MAFKTREEAVKCGKIKKWKTKKIEKLLSDGKNIQPDIRQDKDNSDKP